MAIGYFIGVGDKTTCNGTVLEGDHRIMMFGIPHAREGDAVSCGRDGKMYQVLGGVSHVVSHGRRVAGTLDSISGCGCKARLIPSVLTATYRNQSTPTLSETEPFSQVSTQSHVTQSGGFDERFRLLNHRGVPLGLLGYAVLQNGQCVARGSLDAQGQSCICKSASPTPLNIVFSAPSPLLG